MWRDSPVVELGNGSPDTYGGQHKTGVQALVNNNKHEQLETYWLEEPNTTHVPFKVVSQTQKDW